MFDWLRRLFQNPPAMYERFTDRARKVMQLANREAQRFNHEYIGTEHVLLGLIKEGHGMAANVLTNLNVDLRKVRRETERIVQHGPGGEQVVVGRLPHTPRAKKVIEYSIEEARNLNHNYVGTEHLLLGLIREEEGVAYQVLMNLGLKLEDVREEVLNLLGHTVPDHAPRHTVSEPLPVVGRAPLPSEAVLPPDEHFQSLLELMRRVMDVIDSLGVPPGREHEFFAARLALEEAIVNLIKLHRK
jgi:ATP-dependent Clp protease ATP-binding subunit ClpC